jgi:uncharacterized protein (DUF1330 family)
MPAYIIFTRLHTRDRSELDLYAKEAPKFFAGHNAKFLSRFGASEVLEGPGAEGVGILEFPTIEEARAWYQSPIYKEAAKHRPQGGDYSVIITEGM